MNTIKYNCLSPWVILLSACDDMELLSGKGKFYYSNLSAKTIRFKLVVKIMMFCQEDKDCLFF